MKWNSENDVITEDVIKEVENALGVNFSEDFLFTIMLHNGGYPSPNRILIDGNEEVVNNLVSFREEDTNFIVDIIEDVEGLKETKLIPIAEDPFGNLFCYDFTDEKGNIVFWNHEKYNELNNAKKVCDNFSDFFKMLHD